VVHRSDGSGTTFIWTDYLSKVNSDWANGPGKGPSPSWPVGVGGKGNENVAGLVRQLPGAVGYVELIYALQNNISFGEVKNASGKWVKASIEGVTAAAANLKQMPADYRVSITNAPGAASYPISSFHLSADSCSRRRSGQGQGHQGSAELDRQVWRERGFLPCPMRLCLPAWLKRSLRASTRCSRTGRKVRTLRRTLPCLH